MFDKFMFILLVFASGVLVGMKILDMVCQIEINEKYEIPMNALGIEKFRHCVIDTPNCHSNWYEIIYKKDLNE